METPNGQTILAQRWVDFPSQTMSRLCKPMVCFAYLKINAKLIIAAQKELVNFNFRKSYIDGMFELWSARN
jgi:hypothetical protein